MGCKLLNKVLGSMANGKLLLIATVAAVAICNLRPTFVPPPTQRAVPAACAVAAMAALSAPAYADIDSAAKKLAATSYPFLKEIDWTSPIYESLPGASNAVMLMGAAMDGKLLQDAVMAHHKAIGSGNGKACSQADYEKILATLGKAIASVPESTVLDTFNAYKAIIGNPTGFPAAFSYLMSTVNPADAYATGGAFLSSRTQ